ncbi:MAG: hypothetical protein HY429_00860 [Candidatus Levybacteria bacterium]|nr:hypothetical protein [Candidatus Levybacteria bacterium]
MKTILLENIVKNAIVSILLIALYPTVYSSFNALQFLDKSTAVSFLAAIGLVSVIACFGNFAFTYEKIKDQKFDHRLFAHVTTSLLMLIIGLTLEMTSVVVQVVIGNFVIFNFCLFLLYVASVFYDFWDLNRVEL